MTSMLNSQAESKAKDYVLAIMPRAGLGNKLLVWARAYLFATLNQLPFYTSPWEQFKIGPILRRERDPRLYTGYFKHGQRMSFFLHYGLSHFSQIVINPPANELLAENTYERRVFLFRWNTLDGDYFREIKTHYDLVRLGILEMTLTHHLNLVEESQPPVIGIHIRRGDFPELKPGEDFNAAGLARTPLSYFVEMIQKVRSITQSLTPISIFSDARPEELAPLLELPNVNYRSTDSAIADILLLASSKVIILSGDSTFGYWSAYLSTGSVIYHPKNSSFSCRDDLRKESFFEGAVASSTTEWPEALVKRLKELD